MLISFREVADLSHVAILATIRGDVVPRWMLNRRLYDRKRNALLLLTLSGAIRSADVEVPFLRERRFRGSQKAAGFTTHALADTKQSVWSMDLKRFFSQRAGHLSDQWTGARAALIEGSKQAAAR